MIFLFIFTYLFFDIHVPSAETFYFEMLSFSVIYIHQTRFRSHTNTCISKIAKHTRYSRYLQVNAYRFSISWSRLLPNGLKSSINQEGIKYYNNLIDGLIAEGIKPMVTLFHWDLPAYLENNYGGFLNSSIQQYYTDYADICFRYFGDRVRTVLVFIQLI